MPWNPNVPIITNRVQDDLNAIRENFQHLDQLAERVDELQTVSELAPIANDLQTVSGLAQITDDLQTVSGLAQITDDLQTVSGLAPVAGELQAVSALAPYVQALLDSRIVEMGSNANGEYVRWENGLQVCFARLTASRASAVVLASTWTFPAAFINANYTVVFGLGNRPTIAGNSDPYAKTLWLHAFNRTASACELRLLVNDQSAASGDSAIFDAVAVGRWK